LRTDLLTYTARSDANGFSKGLLETKTVASGSPDQAVTTYDYNSAGLVTRQTARTGTSDPDVVTNFTYTTRGELDTATDADGRLTKYTYDAMSRPLTKVVKDEQGNILGSWTTTYTETGEVRVIKMTTAVDAGPIINLQNLEGQIEGGMDMGAGFALREEYVAGQTRDWVTFKFPTMKTAFDMQVITRETPRVRGPMGATGVGEMTLVPTAPAIVNAIKDAVGVWICDLPATPARVKAALARRG